MNTQNEISLLADQELEAAVGGRMATGMDPKPAPGGVVKGEPGWPLFNTLVKYGTVGVLVDIGVALIFG